MEKSDYLNQMSRLDTFKKPSMELLDSYWLAFQKWDVNRFAYCVTRILQDEERFPKVPIFQKYYLETNDRPELGGKKDDGYSSFDCLECECTFAVHRNDLDDDRKHVHCPGLSPATNCRRTFSTGYLKKLLAKSGRSYAQIPAREKMEFV